jgi:hypothetical protein
MSGWVIAAVVCILALTALITYAAELDLRMRRQRFRESLAWLERRVQGR